MVKWEEIHQSERWKDREIMSYKIAIASKDGKVVSEHFGHSRRFCIVVIDQVSWEVIEVREVEPPCTGEGCTFFEGSSISHTEEAIAKVAKTLWDCKYVIVSQIGYGAERILNDNRIEVRLHKGLINEYLNHLTVQFDKNKKN